MTAGSQVAFACLLVSFVFVGVGRAEAVDYPVSPRLGFYGSPKGLWDKGLSMSEMGANLVVVPAASVTPEMAERCHAEGAQVFADFAIFAGAEVAEKHPELWPIGADGKRLRKQEWYLGLCPTYEWYRRERLTEIRNLLVNVPVDGIYLDFIRWPCHWEVSDPRLEQSCFCDNALSLFSRDTGISIYGLTTRQKAHYIRRHYPQAWAQWRAEDITSFVREARNTVEKARPGTLLGVFTVPWKPEEYDNAIMNIIGQDFPALADHVDVFSPMVYHAMCNRDVTWVGEYSKWLAEATGKAVWPIVQVKDASRAVSAEEFAEVLHQALCPATRGVLVFTLDALLEQREKLEVARQVFCTFKEGSQ